ncbi:HpcH/HpaI aldolase/citrate lyase family protein [Amorphus sp. 3PC139-8]|uniref:HpcH/HpaI aldolase family protein n=1 Tax=Amorphus sp. 3PC139-8 TaxID=2735676 RepID=UPI00345DE57F
MQIETNRFKAAITSDTPQIGVWSSLCSNIAAEILATAGFDWVLIDMEHAPNDPASVLSQLQAYTASGTTPVVRPPWNEPVMVKRLLDIGCFSLLFPMVQTPEEAEAAVRSCRYPPRGTRGVALTHRGNKFGLASDYAARIEDELAILVQIETMSALERVDEIAAVDGVTGVFFGPADLSADMGLFGQLGHPDLTAAIERGCQAVQAAGKPSGILVTDVDLSVNWLEKGMRFVACGTDAGLIAKGGRALSADVRAKAGLS